MTKETVRVLELLKRFNLGQKVCIEQLLNDPLWFNPKKQEQMSEKSVRRDLDVIKNSFPEAFELIRGGRGEKGCYKAVTQQAFDNFLKPDALSLLIQTFNIAQRSDLFDNFDIEPTDRKILQKKVKEISSNYEFKNKPFETKKDDYILLKKLEFSIYHQKYIVLEYPTLEGFERVEVKPYKIVFINENFYLACEVDHDEYQFSMYRISKIKNIEETKKTFQKNYEIEDFIKDMQTPFAKYQRNFKLHLIDVILEVDKSKAFFFQSKNFLKSQKILETKANGNLLIGFKVTQYLEIDELIKRWIPFVKVVQPAEFKERLEQDVNSFLSFMSS